MRDIVALGYVGLGVSDIAAWERFAAKTLGLQPFGIASDGARRYRVDAQVSRILLYADARDDILFAGFEAPNVDCLLRLSERLSAAGFETRRGTKEECAHRDVVALLHTIDPEGLSVEIYVGARQANDSPFQPSRAVSGFVTGPLGLGHIVLRANDRERMKGFWSDALGFSTSDFMRVTLAPELVAQVVFLHCNPRHHTVALASMPLPKRLMHFMLELRSLDDVGRAYYDARAEGAQITAEIGRHSNDHMISFYMSTPSHFEVEYGYGGRLIDPEVWSVESYSEPSMWGHTRSAAI